MFSDIIKSVFKNFETFLVAWAIIIIVNQIFVFGACFAAYCIAAALPHTSVIAALLIHFGYVTRNQDPPDNQDKTQNIDFNQSQSTQKIQIDDSKHQQKTNETRQGSSKEDPKNTDVEVCCPKCGSPMFLRTAKRGTYSGKQFLGCSTYPKCSGIVNIK